MDHHIYTHYTKLQLTGRFPSSSTVGEFLSLSIETKQTQFKATGTAVEVWGSVLVKNAQTNPDPDFECFVDDINISKDDPISDPANNWRFCQKDQLPDLQHTLRIDVTVRSPGQAFWLDRVLYVPSENVPLDDKVIFLENTDPSVHFDAKWQSLGDTANMTTQTNSTTLVDFVGE